MWSVQSSLVPAAEWWDRQVVGCTSPPPPGCALLPSLGLLGLQARESWLVIRLLPPPPTAISHFFLLISPFEIVKATAEEIIKSFGLRRFEAMNKPRYSQFQECPCLLVFCFVSSEGALYVILPYDYQAAARPLFEHTPVLNNNFEYWCRDDFVDCED